MAISCANVHAAIGEFQRTYIYKLFFESVPTVVSAAFPNAISFSAKVDLYNNNAVWPNRKTNAIEVKWGGEFFHIPGTDASKRDQEFSFFDDQPQWVYDFFSALKDLTGNEINQAGVVGTASKFNIGIAKVSVDKETITAYRRLVGCRVYGVESDEISKEGDQVSHLKVDIHWDRNQDVPDKRGKKV